MRPEKLSDPRKPKLRRNRITSANFWPFWPPGNRIDAKFGAPVEIQGLGRLTAKFACLQKPATSSLYDMMNGWTMWGMGSSWFVICVVILLGVAALFGYLLFNRGR